ncbi:hypothetical protein BGZ51_003517 [Haplosporangium sp. Z 767]|nr:hypothetical protein BGZ51_003517 [Haplosporangium sp. Z 767]KAF9191363.1 hypothetical protein BGZ50_009418 [Haplosporangium sp. Z 11]
MDPRKMKVTELKEQLQMVGLSANGKKEELVARLLEHQQAEDAVNAGGLPTGAGDNFDWDESKFDVDDLAPPPSDSTTTATGLSELTDAPADEKTSTTNTSTAPAKTDVASETTTAAQTTATPPTTSGSPSTSTTSTIQSKETVSDADLLKAEYEKRKSRAARFGIPLKEQDKAIERAARFGVPVTASATASLPKATSATKTPTTPSKGLPTTPGSIAAQIPADVLLKRQERFGIQAPAAKPSAATGVAKPTATSKTTTKASIYTLDAAEEEKKRKRAAKFGLAPATEDPSKKTKV